MVFHPPSFTAQAFQRHFLIINKKKPKERENKVLFINAELEYQEGKNQNKLRDIDIQHIIDVYDGYEDTKTLLQSCTYR